MASSTTQYRFFYFNIKAAKEPAFDTWVQELVPQVRNIISDKEYPSLAFFKRKKDQEYGCIVKYESKRKPKNATEEYEF